jgi:hypothetical protein
VSTWLLAGFMGVIGGFTGAVVSLVMNWHRFRGRKGEMSESELRDAVGAVLNTPNVSADEMVFALRGFLQMTDTRER